MARKADDAFSSIFLILLFVGGVMFVMAWINNELPEPLMRLLHNTMNAPIHGGR